MPQLKHYLKALGINFARINCSIEKPEKARLEIPRTDHCLRFHAGNGSDQRSCGRLYNQSESGACTQEVPSSRKLRMPCWFIEFGTSFVGWCWRVERRGCPQKPGLPSRTATTGSAVRLLHKCEHSRTAATCTLHV